MRITGKALMLDEIINYVQSLQRQVEFLSMKLATMNPELVELDTHYRQLPPASQDADATAAISPYASAAADPFCAANAAQLDYSCPASSFHHGCWEAQDLQSILHDSTAAADHCHHDLYASPSLSPPAPQPHRHRSDSFHGNTTI